MINFDGEVILPVVYDSMNLYNKTIICGSKNGKYGLMDENGKESTPFIYDKIYLENDENLNVDSIIKVRKDDKYGFIDNSGKEIAPLIYDEVSPFNEGCFAGKKGGIWYIVQSVNHNQYITGYTDNTFKPQNAVTREEFAQMMYNLDGKENADNIAAFPDVTADRWSVNAVSYAKQNDLINGYPDGKFYPENTITFAEACKILCRLNGFEESQTSENVHWGQAYIDAITKNCNISLFEPDYKMTRLNIVKLINAVEEILPDKANIDEMSASPFTDLDKTDPDYYNIVEATLTRVNSDTE